MRFPPDYYYDIHYSEDWYKSFKINQDLAKKESVVVKKKVFGFWSWLMGLFAIGIVAVQPFSWAVRLFPDRAKTHKIQNFNK